MAIVATYQCGHVRVNFADDAYRDASPEEIERRIKHMNAAAADILCRAELRKQAERSESKETPETA